MSELREDEYHAFFSAEQKIWMEKHCYEHRGYGRCYSGPLFYNTLDGKSVECTMISKNRYPEHGYSDMKYLGLITIRK